MNKANHFQPKTIVFNDKPSFPIFLTGKKLKNRLQTETEVSAKMKTKTEMDPLKKLNPKILQWFGAIKKNQCMNTMK